MASDAAMEDVGFLVDWVGVCHPLLYRRLNRYLLCYIYTILSGFIIVLKGLACYMEWDVNKTIQSV